MVEIEAERHFVICHLLSVTGRNDEQIRAFLSEHSNAELLPLPFEGNVNDDKSAVGFQFIPQENGGDGFYYAKLRKRV
ncbi:ribosomal RNA small subunit methyltransferase B [Rodentibacter pneumotropicus]|uniref:Ribosomal RNA small subunit methyltransferase B n=1 Tax=Rodentibacter pneumotropicus TaxID=758 RepID=A0A3S4U4G9_9PAST|nr:ribosomal RNA small subunit methyltransferase B [Rodentibacter pneumotropicus]